MQNITIELQLSEKVEKKLDTIIELLQGLKPNCHSCVESATRVMGETIKTITETPTAPQEEPKTEEVKSDHPVDAVPAHAEPEPVAPIEEPKQTITHDMIQSRVKQLISKGTPEQNAGARQAVTSRARNISSLLPEQLEAVWADLIALGEV